MEHKVNGDINYGWYTWSDPKTIWRGNRKHGNKRTSRNNADYSIRKISKNSEKNPGDFRRFAFTQTPERSNQVKLWEKLSKE